MSATRYNIYEIQLQDLWPGPSVTGSGGTLYVATAGAANKATLYNADTYAALANPVTGVNGKFRFATLATLDSVDVYGMSAGGVAFQRRGVTPFNNQEIFLEAHRPDHTLVIPWAAADVTAATEYDTGFNLPVGAMVMPFTAIRVTVVDATETIDVGLLSSETGGDADGFVVAASVATLGTIKGALVGTDTLGALLKEDTNAASVFVPSIHPVNTTAVSVSLTTSAGSDTGQGFLMISYIRVPL